MPPPARKGLFAKVRDTLFGRKKKEETEEVRESENKEGDSSGAESQEGTGSEREDVGNASESDKEKNLRKRKT